MPFEAPFQNKKVLVQGLGRFGGGAGVSRWLVEQGALVTVTDTAPPEQLAESVAQLAGLGDRIRFKLGGHDRADFTSCDLLVTNPAVDKAASEHVRAALAAGIPWTTEMNLFLERCRGFTIGVTGSVGKSTTTSLIYEALKAGLEACRDDASSAARQDAALPRSFLGGNIGKSLLSELPSIRRQDLIVLELSSFMLEDTPLVRTESGGAAGWSPNIAVVTNLFPNHLDRHHIMAQYAAAKQNILQFQRPGDVAILNEDHELIRHWGQFARGKVVKYSARGCAALELLMPGEHNQSNARAALAVLDNLPISVNRAAALSAIMQFRGLAHRLQLVHVETLSTAPATSAPRSISYYNDSKATSPDASITALQSFPPGTAIFIVGGYDKHIDLGAFVKLLAERAGGVIGIGQTGESIITQIRASGSAATDERRVYAGTLEAAVDLARRWLAESGSLDAVVLSPASASWDQFPNYEVRGERFAALVRPHR